MDIYTIDYETAWDRQLYSLSKMSTTEYIRDERFEVIGAGVRFPGVESYRWMESAEFAQWVLTVDWSRSALLAHNAAFDAAILSWIYGVVPSFYFDTLSMARGIFGAAVKQGKSLAKLAEVFGLGAKGEDTVWSSGMWRKDFTMQQWLQYGRYCMQDCALTWRLFETLLPGLPPEELCVIDQVIRMFADPRLILDEEKVADFHTAEVARKQALIDTLENGVKYTPVSGDDDPIAKFMAALPAEAGYKNALMSNEKFAQLLIALGVVPPQKWSEAKQEMTWAFSKSDVEFKALLEHDDPRVKAAVNARLGNKSTINETRAVSFMTLGMNGQCMPVFYNYSGAHTHRFSGGDGVNWQNLERVNRKKGKGVLRDAIMAQPGHELVEADSNAIEARGVAWAAQAKDLLEAFAGGRDVYSEFASAIYGRVIDRNKNPEDEQYRLVGKTGILGLGFGMGVRKFATVTQTGPMGNDPIIFTMKDAMSAGVNVPRFASRTDLDKLLDDIPTTLSREDLIVHTAVCDHVVQTYRKTYPEVTDLWWSVCPRLIDAMYTGERLTFRGCMVTEKGALQHKAGLRLRYPDLEVAYTAEGKQVASYNTGKWRTKLYGGLLLENIIQFLARCIVMEQMVAAAETEKVVMSTHDAITLHVPDARVLTAVQDLTRIMRTSPSWAPDWPLSAKASHAKRYGELK